MKNVYNNFESVTMYGRYIGNLDNYYTFHLENEDIIAFDEINTKILETYNLNNSQFKNELFKITYSEIFDNLDQDDYVLFRLEKLQKI